MAPRNGRTRMTTRSKLMDIEAGRLSWNVRDSLANAQGWARFALIYGQERGASKRHHSAGHRRPIARPPYEKDQMVWKIFDLTPCLASVFTPSGYPGRFRTYYQPIKGRHHATKGARRRLTVLQCLRRLNARND